MLLSIMMVRRGIIWVLLVLVVAVGTVHSQEEFLVSIEFDPNPEMTTTSTTTTVASSSTTTTLASSSTTRSTSRMPTTMEESLEKSLEESLEVLPDSLETPNETDFVESHLNNLVPRRNRTQGKGGPWGMTPEKVLPTTKPSSQQRPSFGQYVSRVLYS